MAGQPAHHGEPGAQLELPDLAARQGPQHTQIYNDGYWPICADKHPTSMGQDFSECWASAFPAIGDASAAPWPARRLSSKTSGCSRPPGLPGAFSFSPIRDESGQIVGLFHPVTETTAKMISQRHAPAARRGRCTPSLAERQLAAQVLAEADLDVPFALFYQLKQAGHRLAASAGLLSGGSAAVAMVTASTLPSRRPDGRLPKVAASGARAIEDVAVASRASFAFPTWNRSRPPPCCRSRRRAATGPSAFSWQVSAHAAAADRSLSRLHDRWRPLPASWQRPWPSMRKGNGPALADIDRAKTAFFSNVSHEFRTPLTLMLIPSKTNWPNRRSPAAHPARAPGNRAPQQPAARWKLVNSLLDFARSGRSGASLFQPIDLARFTADLAANFRAACRRRTDAERRVPAGARAGICGSGHVGRSSST